MERGELIRVMRQLAQHCAGCAKCREATDADAFVRQVFRVMGLAAKPAREGAIAYCPLGQPLRSRLGIMWAEPGTGGHPVKFVRVKGSEGQG